MPGMDGLEVAERVKARRPWTPVVIVTGYGTPASEERARAAGVAGFLHKPLSPEMIEGSAARALEAAASIPAAVAEAAAGIAAKVEPPRGRFEWLKVLAMMVAAPYIGLAFVLALPFAGVALIAWHLGRALMKIPSARKVLVGAKNVGLFVASPFIGLAYVLVGPFVGIAALAWFGTRALLNKRRESE
jgi:CheY-like chemotaxis protein